MNKLTPQKFKTLVEQIMALNIETTERLEGVIDRIFEKVMPVFYFYDEQLRIDLNDVISGSFNSEEVHSDKFSMRKYIAFRLEIC